MFSWICWWFSRGQSTQEKWWGQIKFFYKLNYRLVGRTQQKRCVTNTIMGDNEYYQNKSIKWKRLAEINIRKKEICLYLVKLTKISRTIQKLVWAVLAASCVPVFTTCPVMMVMWRKIGRPSVFEKIGSSFNRKLADIWYYE